MFSRTNIEKQLHNYRSKRIDENLIMEEVQRIFAENDKERAKIISNLAEANSLQENNLNFEFLETGNIYHLMDIKNLCVNYRLRFLDSKYFKGEFPEEAISEIRNIEKEHNTILKNLKIVAPAKLMKLENADDPLLFAPIGNDYFYLIHKWGNDLQPFRKILMWPYKSFENLVFTVAVLSILLTSLVPIQWFTPNPGTAEYIFLALFIFKGVGGFVIFYGFSKGKNFNAAIWMSKYYNG